MFGYLFTFFDTYSYVNLSETSSKAHNKGSQLEELTSRPHA
jgi:hypothetical protein